MTSTRSTLWFPGPPAGDDSWAEDGETTCDWLARSAKPRAREARRFLNENLAHLPEEHQPLMVHALRHRWPTALFELIVMRLMQEWGAELEIEVPNADGRCPDIIALFADGEIVVEATSPIYNGAMGRQMAAKLPLVRIVEKLLPPGYCFAAWEIPELGLSQSRQSFKRAVQEMLRPFHDFPSEQLPMEGVEVAANVDEGQVRLRMFPARVLKSEQARRETRCLYGPAVSGAVDDVSPIRNAVRRKRTQVRASTAPVILALHGGNLGADIEDFDQALIGYRLGRKFVFDGELYKRARSDKPPTYAGVLALRDVGLLGMQPPVFYPHPRFQGTLSQSIRQLASRVFNSQNQQVEEHRAASQDEAVPQLHFVHT